MRNYRLRLNRRVFLSNAPQRSNYYPLAMLRTLTQPLPEGEAKTARGSVTEWTT